MYAKLIVIERCRELTDRVGVFVSFGGIFPIGVKKLRFY